LRERDGDKFDMWIEGDCCWGCWEIGEGDEIGGRRR